MKNDTVLIEMLYKAAKSAGENKKESLININYSMYITPIHVSKLGLH